MVKNVLRSLRTRLIFGSLIIATVTLLTAAFAYSQLNGVISTLNDEAIVQLEGRGVMEHASYEILKLNEPTLTYLLYFGDEENMAKTREVFGEVALDVVSDVEEAAAAMPDKAGEKLLLGVAEETKILVSKAETVLALADQEKMVGPKTNAALTEYGEARDKTLSEVKAVRKAKVASAEKSVKAATAKQESAARLIKIIALIAVGLAAATGYLMARLVHRPVSNLIQAVRRIDEGDLETKAEKSSINEFNILATAFNKMTGNLKQMIESEKTVKEHLQTTVGQYRGFVDQVAAGDLAVRLSVNGNEDELASLGRNLNKMVASLNDMTGNISLATTDITSASSEIFAATSQHNSGASEQAAAINQTTVTVDEVRQTAEQTTERAQFVAQSAKKSVEISDEGMAAVDQTVVGMNQIKNKVEQIAANIIALSEQTQQIGEIISTVNDIAEQSNLLALNASIEAARAGEQGKGFAVVASEVRNLAEQSQQATSQVRAILDDIQKATNTVVMVTEEGTKHVDSGLEKAESAGDTIKTLAGSINEASEAAQQIVASVEQQAAGMDQIAAAMTNINQSTSQSLVSTKQTEEATQKMVDLGDRLKDMILTYKTSA